MRRAIAVHTRGHWPDEAAVDTVTLPYLDRHRRRIRLVADSGAPFLLDLPRDRGQFNYGPWYFYVTGALVWLVGYSLTVVPPPSSL